VKEASVLPALWSEWLAWWSTVPTEFAFLLALPFAVGAIGLFGDAWRRRRDR
jgi:hypothetical protein